ncbi:unnamed protein product [Triticum turgidum subsp. durum]|uniref:Uncharacterized protein n=1 Tax=Triticum turgidum subsp. durum TaxID=4567 RepID=A0A9R1P6U4_TRITD|nr:unnamed protein product [Triticum turgidum subsp. durum]
MGALAESIASHVPSGMLSAGLAALAALPNPGELVRKAARLEDELRELLRLNGRGAGAGAEQGGGNRAQQTRERFLRAYERLKDELLKDRAFNFDFTEETRQWVAKVRAPQSESVSSYERMINPYRRSELRTSTHACMMVRPTMACMIPKLRRPFLCLCFPSNTISFSESPLRV